MTTGLTSFSTEEDPGPSSATGASDVAESECVSPSTDMPEGEGSDESNPESWRGEVSARLQRFRTRRKPSGPRYPSLLLPFDPPEYRYRPSPPRSEGSSALEALASSTAEQSEVREEIAIENRHTAPPVSEAVTNRWIDRPELSAKVIEFPRFAAIPEFHGSDLADPVMDRPRIVEAPEVLPPPPALGGMLIEPAFNPAVGLKDELDLPSAPASVLRRVLAATIDVGIVGAAMVAFAAIFERTSAFQLRENLLLSLGTLSAAALLLWMIYAFLFIVYTGSTPGIAIARLELAAFDGKPVRRTRRRWRVIASFLSAFSAGLGYLWCFLDDRGLCWHDRITRTYLKNAK